eukprot:TRINITY_DN3678_c0_g1_i5.p1 TRINITY_DN3678_c0_g1~~TRINITY_DN3678_c0_g1_i5.p1  ORF type:complete len:247 (+),score=70.71 TRINITY_DN3678_c0_g1_i5:106-741(+)
MKRVKDIARSQRPASAYPKSIAQSTFALQLSVQPVEICASVSNTKLAPLSTSKDMRLASANQSLHNTLELAVQSFADKRQLEDISRRYAEAEKSAEMDAVLEDDEVVNKETYALKKKELQDLVKELNERDAFVNQQKAIIQRLNHQVRILKTQVQDPLEVLLLRESRLKSSIRTRCFKWKMNSKKPKSLSLIHICRCRRYAVCRSRWSPYH